ncbi:DUF6573 family protein [Mangrovibacterium sp.]|uniref:DUF6573 family protein n=1 Tax=Mangrovibacterium sp. TaxID=1961364 RepID=UPI003561A49A
MPTKIPRARVFHMSKEFQIISSYTTKQAIADGVLVPVDSKISEEAGIVYPVLVTGTVWNRYIKVPEGMEHQDLDGRLWDMLFMFAVQVRKSKGGALLFFKVLFLAILVRFVPPISEWFVPVISVQTVPLGS